jgi:hypothetical protein
MIGGDGRYPYESTDRSIKILRFIVPVKLIVVALRLKWEEVRRR